MSRKWFSIARSHSHLDFAAQSFQLRRSARVAVHHHSAWNRDSRGLGYSVSADAGSQVQLRALGTYLHPPVTKDITNQVTWTSNTPQMFTISSTGLLTATGLSCGGTLVSATVSTNADGSGVSSSGAIVTGYMTANVICYSSTTGSGGGSQPTLTVTFPGTGLGTVSSSPLGLRLRQHGNLVQCELPHRYRSSP